MSTRREVLKGLIGAVVVPVAPMEIGVDMAKGEQAYLSVLCVVDPVTRTMKRYWYREVDGATVEIGKEVVCGD